MILTSFGIQGYSQESVTLENKDEKKKLNYDSGIHIFDHDSIYKLELGLRIQNYITYNFREAESNDFDSGIRLFRLKMEGYALSPKLNYRVQLGFSKGDMGEMTEIQNRNIVLDAVLSYRFNKMVRLGIGQGKLPGNRQKETSSANLQLTERSVANNTFNLDRDFGLFFDILNEKENQFSWNVKSALSTGHGRSYRSSSFSVPAVTVKLELFPLGSFTNSGAYFEGDLVRKSSPKILSSVAWHYNSKAVRSHGTFGGPLINSRDIQSLFLDFVFKYQGFAGYASYMNRSSKNPLENPHGVAQGHGYDLQSSYLMGNDWEIIGRYSKVAMNNDIVELYPGIDKYTIGVTKYYIQHKLKLQLETGVEKLTSGPLPNPSSLTYLRFQATAGF